jgi:hypothetical protein
MNESNGGDAKPTPSERPARTHVLGDRDRGVAGLSAALELPTARHRTA